jgi:hypothetical protein
MDEKKKQRNEEWYDDKCMEAIKKDCCKANNEKDIQE